MFKNEIKYYHVLDKCAFFVTNDNRVYGIKIPFDIMTSSYKCELQQCKSNYDIKILQPIEFEGLKGKKLWNFMLMSACQVLC